LSTAPELPEQPLLAPWYRLVEDGPRLVLEHGHRVLTLDGGAVRTLLPRLLPLLDGTRTVGEIVAVVGPPAEAAVHNALALLAAQGVLVDGPVPACGAELRETAFGLAAEATLAPAVVAARLTEARLGVVGEGVAGAEAARVLRRAGIGCIARRGWDAASCTDAVVLVAPAADELLRLEGWNTAALAAGLSWLQLLPYDGCFAAVGPLYVAGETACLACYRLRRAASLGIGELATALDVEPTRSGGGPAVDVTAGAIAALHLLRWLGIRDPYVPGVLFAVELRGGVRVTAHPVLRVPRCPACSPLAARAAPLPWFQPGAERAA
jgi:bacteriocin biosynthesis cyclodehydratase domain-containing protein